MNCLRIRIYVTACAHIHTFRHSYMRRCVHVHVYRRMCDLKHARVDLCKCTSSSCAYKQYVSKWVWTNNIFLSNIWSYLVWPGTCIIRVMSECSPLWILQHRYAKTNRFLFWPENKNLIYEYVEKMCNILQWRVWYFERIINVH